MSKIKDIDYFENFKRCAQYSSQAAKLLYGIMQNFHSDRLKNYLTDMHKIEQLADVKKHEVSQALVKAFITPIEREDIVDVSRNLDDLTDRIEDVLIKIYCNNVKVIRPDALELTEIVNLCADAVLELMSEFKNFKRSKKLKDCIIKINSLEEQADRKFIECMRKLHSQNDDIFEITVWRDIYFTIEKCSDTAEHIADIVETVIMKNS